MANRNAISPIVSIKAGAPINSGKRKRFLGLGNGTEGALVIDVTETVNVVLTEPFAGRVTGEG
jgi:hypothetical protein